MTDIFLSYASADRDRVSALVAALQDDGFTVWWDRDIRPGPSFDREIEQAIDNARCMIVLWSEHSIESEWVRSEVEEGVRRGILVPALLDPVMPPLAYRRRQTADLSAWDGDADEHYEQLLTGIRATLERPADTPVADHPHGEPAPSPRKRGRRRRVSVASATLVTILASASAGLAAWLVATAQAPETGPRGRDPVRLELRLPEGLSIARGVNRALNITPRGDTLTFIATNGRVERYFVRPLGSYAARALDLGDDEIGSHWLSPDGKSLIYNESGARIYRQVPLTGGPSSEVTPTGRSPGGIRGLTSNRAGAIVYASDTSGLSLLPASGGEPEPLTNPDDGTVHSVPQFSPSGQLVFFAESSGDAPEQVKVIALDTREVRALMPGDRPVLTNSGHLIALREGSLWAAPFDEGSISLQAPPIAVVDGLGLEMDAYAVADNGTLVFLPEVPDADREDSLSWVSRDGTTQGIPVALNSMEFPRLSPDGRNLLIHGAPSRSAGNTFNIWNYSLEKGTTAKLSFSAPPALSAGAAWAPDSNAFLYLTIEDGQSGDLLLGAADGARPPELVSQDAFDFQATIAPDGRTVIFGQCPGREPCDLARKTLGKDGSELLFSTPFDERSPELSPDGRWLAYSSDESGRREVYVRPYPDVEARRWQVSTDGGEVPMWSKDGGRLLFVQASSNELLEVSVSTDDSFNWTPPEAVLDLESYTWGVGPWNERSFDISNDGERFLLIGQRRGVDRIMVVLNWLEEVRRLAPAPGDRS